MALLAAVRRTHRLLGSVLPCRTTQAKAKEVVTDEPDRLQEHRLPRLTLDEAALAHP